MSKIEHWNTGRHYTRRGQVIYATRDGDKVLFADLSRGICGEFLNATAFADMPLREVVMRHYDANNYTGGLSGRAWEFYQKASRMDGEART